MDNTDFLNNLLKKAPKTKYLHVNDICRINKIKDPNDIAKPSIEKLYNDGYLNRLTKKHKGKLMEGEEYYTYMISFKGIDFIDSGGYKSLPNKWWERIPKRKTIYKIIINSTISRFTSTIIGAVIAGLIILIIWELYKNSIIEIWSLYF